mmetsp:Transcript_52864/g.158228  ORF Transcript_52864/g.158228 Transcript_52864/m.158228 type:complete len:257 (-) Transcript_52864:245-1015(-)
MALYRRIPLIAFCANAVSSQNPSSLGVRSKESIFDFYVLAMSYQAEFCHKHRSDHFDGCLHPLEEWRGALTIHGLWPQNSDGTWPAKCTDEPFDPTVLDDIGFEKFTRLWPNVKAESRGEPGYTDFWAHEWTKHGTCSGLDQDRYFGGALDRAVPTPSLVKERYGATISKGDLVQAYGGAGSVALVCEHGRYLSEARFCLQRNSDNSAGERMLCNRSVLDEDNCGEEIFVANFDSDPFLKASVTNIGSDLFELVED